MTSAWDVAKKRAEDVSSGSGRFLRLSNDGDKAIVVFRGDPLPRELVYIEGKGTEAYTDEHKKLGLKPQLKIAINVFNVETNQAQIAELGAATFKDLVKVRDKYGLDKWAFEYQRNGAKGDSKTKYTLLPEKQLDADLRAKINAVPLFDLDREMNAQAAPTGGAQLGNYKPAAQAAAPAADANGPISADTAAAIIGRLKALPRDKADEYLRVLGVAKVREIPASLEQKALAELDRLTGSTENDDPFS